MFQITKKDKKEILKILFAHDCKCRMGVLVEKYSYENDRKSKSAKIREVIKVLNKELQKKVKVEIIEKHGNVEIYFE